MPSIPNHSINFYAPLAASAPCSIGQVMIPDASTGSFYVVATAANRGTRGSEGVAVSAWGGVPGSVGVVKLQQDGILAAELSLLPPAVGRKLVRCSVAGAIERIDSFTSGDDVIGFAEEDGRVHLFFGLPWAIIEALAGGGGGDTVTFSGDLSGPDEGPQVVERVKGTAITTAGGALAPGGVLRATGVATADWGPLDLADSDARTGVLPTANGGTGLSAAGSDGNVLTASGGVWTSAAPTSGAPTNSPYVTIGNVAGLSAERALTAGAGLNMVDGGANSTVTLSSQGPTSVVPDSPSVPSNRLDDYDASVGGVPSDLIHITYNISHGALTITSIANPTENRRITILNADDGTFGTSVILDHAAATGTAANRILCPGGSDITLSTRESALLQYDTATDRWRVVSKSPASSFTAPTGTGFMTTTSGAMNAASTNPANVSTYRLTDTSAAQYDLLVANGSAEFRRFAKGSNSTVLNTSSAGVVNYGLVTLAMFTPGSNGQFLGTVSSLPAWTNNANFYAAFNSAAGAGCFRGANTNNAHTSRNAANNGDVYLCMLGTDDNLYLGSDQADANRTTGNRYNTAGYHYFSVAGSFYLILQSSAVQTRQSLEVGVNIAGASGLSTPLVLKKASIAMSGTTDATLTAAQYSCPFIYLSGSVSGPPTVIAPATEGAIFVVSNDCNGDVRFGTADNTGLTVTSEDTIWAIHTATVSNYTTI